MGAAQATAAIETGARLAIWAGAALVFAIELRQAPAIERSQGQDSIIWQSCAAGLAMDAAIDTGPRSAATTGAVTGIWQQEMLLPILIGQCHDLRHADRPGTARGVVDVARQNPMRLSIAVNERIAAGIRHHRWQDVGVQPASIAGAAKVAQFPPQLAPAESQRFKGLIGQDQSPGAMVSS